MFAWEPLLAAWMLPWWGCAFWPWPRVSMWATDIRNLYPAYLIWGRSVVRLAFAVLLFWLRPREDRWELVGNF